MELTKPIEQYEINDIPHAKKRAVLKAVYQTGGNTKEVLEKAGVPQRTHYHWIKTDPIYAEVYRKQHDRSMEVLEDECLRRAVHGIEEPVFHGGKEVGTRLKYSDNLLMFLMKKRDPAYKDNFQQQVGIWSKDGNVSIEFNIPRPDSTTAVCNRTVPSQKT